MDTCLSQNCQLKQHFGHFLEKLARVTVIMCMALNSSRGDEILQRGVIVKVRAEVDHVIGHMVDQTIRQLGGQPTVGGVSRTTAQLVMKATGVTIEGRTRTMELIKDMVIHLEMTIAVNTVRVPIDR